MTKLTTHPLPASPAISLTARLRSETRLEHSRIETQLDILDSIREPSDYVHLLAGFYTFYLPLEQALLRLDWEGSGVDLTARIKAPLLAADLIACKHDPHGLPLSPRLPSIKDRAEGFGCLYVLEGATLGGEIIHRQLHTRFGPWLEGRDRFYQCYGNDRGKMWRAFKEAADAFGQNCDSAMQDRVIVSAQATFAQLQAWMGQRQTHGGGPTGP